MHSNILIVTQWSYKDALIQTYTLPYVHYIRQALPNAYKIYVLTSEQPRIALSTDEHKVINAKWELENMELIVQPYQRFGLKKLIKSLYEFYRLIRLIKKEKIETIHTFCMPAGGYGYILSKLTGARLIVDSYEPHAESMVENNSWRPEGLAFQLLNFLERKQTERASVIVATTHGMKQYAQKRFNVTPSPFYVKPACVDLQKFQPKEKDQELSQQLGLNNKIVCIYCGKLGSMYLKEEVFDFIKVCYEHWKDRFRFLLLTSTPEDVILEQVSRVEIPRNVVVNLFVFHHQVPRYMTLADFGLTPIKPVPTKRYCTPIKNGEYWAMGLPVVITPKISDDSDIIQDHEIGYVLRELSKNEYRKAVLAIETLLKGDRNELRKKVRSVAEKYRNFSIAESIYREIYK